MRNPRRGIMRRGVPLFGGFDAKATGESCRKERERVAGLLAHPRAADRDKVLGGTAAKRFGFELT